MTNTNTKATCTAHGKGALTYANYGVHRAFLQYESDVLLVQCEVAERAEAGDDEVVLVGVRPEERRDDTSAAASTKKGLRKTLIKRTW